MANAPKPRIKMNLSLVLIRVGFSGVVESYKEDR